MNHVASCFLFCGILTCLVSAVPSPQWVYEQIHALSDNLASETHAKKSKIPYGKDEKKELIHKRKDGVKKLFKFLDAAVEQTESSGGGDLNIPDGSGLKEAGLSDAERHPVSTDLSPQQPKDAEKPKQLQDMGSSAKRNHTGFRTKQGTSETNFMVRDKARLTGYGQQNETKETSSTGAGFTSSAGERRTQVPSSLNQPSAQGLTFSTTQSALQLSNPERQRLTYSSNASPLSKPAEGQHFSSSYQAVTQQRHSSGLITSYRRPPAVPVRSKVSINQPARPHLPPVEQQVLGAPHRSSIQSAPLYASLSVAGSYPYDSYYISQHGFPDNNGKSAAPMQERPYGQPRRQREQFHQQTRAHIPVGAAIATIQRYPVSQSQARFPGQSRSAIQDRLSYKQVTPFGSRARVPVIQRPLMSSQYAGAHLAEQAYYRSAIRQQQPVFSRTAPAQIQGYGYPLMQQTRLARAVISHKPHPRTILTPLAADVARLEVPAQSQASDETYAATTKPVWPTSTLRSGTHPHPDDDD